MKIHILCNIIKIRVPKVYDMNNIDNNDDKIIQIIVN